MHISSTEDFEDPRKSPWRLVSIPDDFKIKKQLGQAPFGQELDIASEIAGSKVLTGLRG